MKCLVVDDQIICRKAVALILEEVAECDDAADGSEAVVKFREALKKGKPYDVVFLDILMPGMSGHDTAREIRNIENQWGTVTKVKIIMLTVLNSINDAMTSFYDAQSVAYLVKPVTEDKLLGTFKELGLF